jgi:hypothetical protein
MLVTQSQRDRSRDQLAGRFASDAARQHTIGSAIDVSDTEKTQPGWNQGNNKKLLWNPTPFHAAAGG